MLELCRGPSRRRVLPHVRFLGTVVSYGTFQQYYTSGGGITG